VRKILALGTLALAGLGTAYALAADQAANSTCDPSVAEALLANRIVAPSQSYRKDNPTEYAKVRTYLEGGARPSTVGMTHMGLHLVYLEDTCRAPDGTSTTTTTTTTTTTEPPPPPVTGSTFDCYGSTPNCTGLTPASCTQTISSGLQAALNSATGGQVICLSSTSGYGSVALTGKSYSSVVTVQPASGVAASVGAVTFNNVDNLRFTGVGAASLGSTSLKVAGTTIDASSGCSSNLTYDHVIFTGGVALRPQFACSVNMNILFDHDRLDNLSVPGGSELGRFHIRYNSGTSGSNGIKVSNSSFDGGCADGVYLDNSPRGTVIGPGNEFKNIDQGYSNSNCGGNHVDPIGAFFDEDTLVTGNWFHDNGSGSGGILNAGSPGLTVTNNVFASTGYPYSIVVKAAVNNTYLHNVFVENVRFQDSDGGANGSGNLVRNNVFLPGVGIISEGTGYAADHNLGVDVLGAPIFLSNPASGYYHYQLASNSPGYHAATDGKSLGIAP
jgi:hypothetical protein